MPDTFSLGIQTLKDGDRAQENLQKVLEVQRDVAYKMIDREIELFTPIFLEFGKVKPAGTKGVLGEISSYPKISLSQRPPSLVLPLTNEQTLVEVEEDKYELRKPDEPGEPDILPPTKMTQEDEVYFGEEIDTLQERYDVPLPEEYALEV